MAQDWLASGLCMRVHRHRRGSIKISFALVQASGVSQLRGLGSGTLGSIVFKVTIWSSNQELGMTCYVVRADPLWNVDTNCRRSCEFDRLLTCMCVINIAKPICGIVFIQGQACAGSRIIEPLLAVDITCSCAKFFLDVVALLTIHVFMMMILMAMTRIIIMDAGIMSMTLPFSLLLSLFSACTTGSRPASPAAPESRRHRPWK
mmetsp:Transcript_1216/g.4990  ORF Transcript_1216/g.4990 Transcript_1216/m.4990 type:complete len:204 (-) Transcript_1216:654-1265(-)